MTESMIQIANGNVIPIITDLGEMGDYQLVRLLGFGGMGEVYFGVLPTADPAAVAEWDDSLNAEVKADYHCFVVPAGTLWSEVTVKTDSIGSRIIKALCKIEQANAAALVSHHSSPMGAHRRERA